MSDPQKALQTQLANIEKRTGRSLSDLHSLLASSGLGKHGEMVALLKEQLGLGHGDANTVVHTFKSAPAASPAASADPLDTIYSGSKAPLRALHEAVMAKAAKLGAFEIAPKKANVSLRRKKQFALVGPGSKGRLEIGLNMRGVEPTDRLVAQPAGGMCQYKVFVTTTAEIDTELMQWIRIAYEAAE